MLDFNLCSFLWSDACIISNARVASLKNQNVQALIIVFEILKFEWNTIFNVGVEEFGI
jgi:hypothetical protein